MNLVPVNVHNKLPSLPNQVTEAVAVAAGMAVMKVAKEGIPTWAQIGVSFAC